MYSSIETIIYGDIALQRIWWCRNCWHGCSLGVYLVIDFFGGYRASFGWKQLCCECQMSIATYLRGYLPSYQVILQCIWNWHATLKSLRTVTHKDRQPQYNYSSVTESRLNYKVASEFVLHRYKYSGPLWLEKTNLAHNRLNKKILALKVRQKILWLVWKPEPPPPPGSLMVAP